MIEFLSRRSLDGSRNTSSWIIWKEFLIYWVLNFLEHFFDLFHLSFVWSLTPAIVTMMLFSFGKSADSNVNKNVPEFFFFHQSQKRIWWQFSLTGDKKNSREEVYLTWMTSEVTRTLLETRTGRFQSEWTKCYVKIATCKLLDNATSWLVTWFWPWRSPIRVTGSPTLNSIQHLWTDNVF